MISADEKNKKEARPPASVAEVKETDKGNHAGDRGNGSRKAGKQHPALPLHRYHAERASKSSPALYAMVLGACILLVGSLALYASLTTRKPWAPAPEIVGSLESTPVVPAAQPLPVQVEQPAPVVVAPPPKVHVQPSFRPNAAVDVPNVSLRNVPDMAMKPTSSGLKRGDRVEIVKRLSGKGPAWVRIKTKSGKVGWVFASLVKERKRG